MKVKTIFIASALSLALPIAATAAPTVTFQGEVTDQTCKATINGQTDSTVLLPTVSSTELSATGMTTGLTPFSISVQDCQVDTADVEISTKFLGHNVTTTGNLGNIATSNPAGNVSIQLTADATGAAPVTLNGVTSVDGLVLKAGQTSATHQFGAQYYAEDAATAGAVTAVAEYTLSYN
ncbi:fimbrial protein [Acinetobacter portensis]|uniref:fimbrial protein n=1 Tax=Acinetobacter portensis TaxID=1839785 RepID=UPI0013D0A1A4|nr:fimbrial protein [Acinetobacter portensis]